MATLLNCVRQECPQLRDLVRPDGRLAGHYLLSLEGKEFLTDLDRVLPSRCRVLLLSADAGGWDNRGLVPDSVIQELELQA